VATADLGAAILARLAELEDLAATLGLTLELHADALGPDALAALQADVEEAARCLEVARRASTSEHSDSSSMIGVCTAVGRAALPGIFS
jgi:hypothetical protein